MRFLKEKRQRFFGKLAACLKIIKRLAPRRLRDFASKKFLPDSRVKTMKIFRRKIGVFKIYIFAIVVVQAFSAFAQADAAGRIALTINDNWKFSAADSAGAEKRGF